MFHRVGGVDAINGIINQDNKYNWAKCTALGLATNHSKTKRKNRADFCLGSVAQKSNDPKQ